MTDSRLTKLPLRVKDITGQKFGKLTALRFAGRRFSSGCPRTIWEFKCECGNIKEIAFTNVNRGKTTSCGCDMVYYRARGKRTRPLTQREKYLKHRSKRLEDVRKYRIKNREKIRAFVRKNRDYYRLKASEYRAKVRSRSQRTDLILAWFKRIKRKKVRCYYCGEVIPKGKLDIDHVIPVIENGPHTVENLAATCSHCNRTKSRKLIKDWERTGQQILSL